MFTKGSTTFDPREHKLSIANLRATMNFYGVVFSRILDTHALRIVRMFSSLPKTTEAQVMGKQVIRSGTSVGANYRETHRARSKAEFISCAGISLREVEETAYWLELLVRSETVAENLLAPLRKECDELTAILITIIKNAKAGKENTK